MHIYLIDHNMIGDNNQKKSIERDTGRTKVLRTILGQIKTSSNSKIEFNALVQVFDTHNNLLELIHPFILFVHTTNSRCEDFLKEIVKKEKEPFWIACYSGGEEPEWYKEFNTKGLQNIRFFGGIGDAVESKWDIPAFVSAVLEKKENAFDYLVRKPKSHLIALSILCQGYLAAKDPSKIQFTDKIDLKNKNINIPADWWELAFGQAGNFNETGVSKEIKTLGKEVPFGITNLFNNKKEPTAEIVFKASEALSEILKA